MRHDTRLRCEIGEGSFGAASPTTEVGGGALTKRRQGLTELRPGRPRERPDPAGIRAIPHGVPLAIRRRMSAAPPPILVVEDDESALSGYLEFLMTAGFAVTGVSDATRALPLALRRPPEAVVTDITLPGMSGFELAAALRADMRTRHVPVIGLTAHWTPEVRTRAADVHLHALLLKPCVPSHLVAELERVLASRRSTAPAV
jgi:CheY-like chemotaxis protein